MAVDRQMVEVEGWAELVALFEELPIKCARRLQGALIANMVDAKKRAIERSDVSAQTRRSLNFVLRVAPSSKGGKRRKVDSLNDVDAEFYSNWASGEDPDDPQAAARRVEKEVGPSSINPRKGRYLAIPAGKLRNKSGKIRATTEPLPGRSPGLRQKRRRVTVAEQKNAYVLETGGKLLVLQKRERKKALKRRTRRVRQDDGTFKRVDVGGRDRTRLKPQLVGVLVPKAKPAPWLDFVNSWESLKAVRDDRFRRLLEDVLKEREDKLRTKRSQRAAAAARARWSKPESGE